MLLLILEDRIVRYLLKFIKAVMCLLKFIKELMKKFMNKFMNKKYWTNICFVVFVVLLILFLFIYPDDVRAASTWIFSPFVLKLFWWGAIFSAVITALYLINRLTFCALLFLIIILIALGACIVIVMFDLMFSQKVCQLFGTSNKKETIEFIAIGMGGVVATIIAAAYNRRAEALELSNELVKKGQTNDRFVMAMKDLGAKNRLTRRSAFYQFYYLAKESQEEVFKWDVFDILCAELRNVAHRIFELKKPCKLYEYRSTCDYNTEITNLLKERYILLNILFLEYFDEYVFDNHEAKLRDAYFMGANLKDTNLIKAELQTAKMSGANLAKANLSKANLSEVDFSGTECWNEEHWNKGTLYSTNKELDYIKTMGANLENANLSKANLSHACLSNANLANANFQETQLNGVDFDNVFSIDGADFYDAKIGTRLMTKRDLPEGKGKYRIDLIDFHWMKKKTVSFFCRKYRELKEQC